MPHVITDLCIRDDACVEVCPVECIVPGQPEAQWPWYYIDPDTCIDCGACVPECPVDAIFPEEDVPRVYKRAIRLNADFFTTGPGYDALNMVSTKPATPVRGKPPALSAGRTTLSPGGVTTKASTRQPIVFISYAHENERQARELQKKLEQRGFRTWFDKENLMPGQDWSREIQRAVKQADFFIACISRITETKRGFVQREFKMALDTALEMPGDSIYIIPVCLEQCNIPSDLGRYHAANIYTPDGFQRLVQSIELNWSKRR